MKKRILGTFLVAATLLTFNGCSSKQEINESNNTSTKEGKFLEASLITGVDTIYTGGVSNAPVVVELEDKKCTALGLLAYEDYKASIQLANIKCDGINSEIKGWFFDKNKNVGPAFSVENNKFIVKPQNGFIYIDKKLNKERE